MRHAYDRQAHDRSNGKHWIIQTSHSLIFRQWSLFYFHIGANWFHWKIHTICDNKLRQLRGLIWSIRVGFYHRKKLRYRPFRLYRFIYVFVLCFKYYVISNRSKRINPWTFGAYNYTVFVRVIRSDVFKCNFLHVDFEWNASIKTILEMKNKQSSWMNK